MDAIDISLFILAYVVFVWALIRVVIGVHGRERRLRNTDERLRSTDKRTLGD